MILVSRNVRYIRDIREGFLGRGVKRLWVVEERNFHRLIVTRYVYGKYPVPPKSS